MLSIFWKPNSPAIPWPSWTLGRQGVRTHLLLDVYVWGATDFLGQILSQAVYCTQRLHRGQVGPLLRSSLWEARQMWAQQDRLQVNTQGRIRLRALFLPTLPSHQIPNASCFCLLSPALDGVAKGKPVCRGEAGCWSHGSCTSSHLRATAFAQILSKPLTFTFPESLSLLPGTKHSSSTPDSVRVTHC